MLGEGSRFSCGDVSSFFQLVLMTSAKARKQCFLGTYENKRW